ncbi:anamorsin homolog isoform X1 [Montipora foliosa]|uniref:anamorsin homolog isoform X1 n=1 Tax=Montipora foliosa TaxID=591990 RepID=UPI0035F13CCC
MMFKGVTEGDQVLLIWSGTASPEKIEEIAHQLKALAGSKGKVALEHEERLLMSSHPDSSFDVVFSGVIFPSLLVHSIDLLAEIARILKPNGMLTLTELIGISGNLRSQEKVTSALKLGGFVNISEAKQVNLNLDQKNKLKETFDELPIVIEVSAFKPVFEVGTSSQLSMTFLSKPGEPKDESVAKIWTLSAQDIDDDEIDILDSDTLLDDDDLLKPDPVSLKSDCGTNLAGKKRACKNCTCGLAEEIEQGKEPLKKTATSSCGSCYLGDAFRCASCPYLGMPAFKPGEKVALTSRQLKGDL